MCRGRSHTIAFFLSIFEQTIWVVCLVLLVGIQVVGVLFELKACVDIGSQILWLVAEIDLLGFYVI